MSVSIESHARMARLVPEGTWQVDPSHSTVEFRAKHMLIATVKGDFTAFEGTLEVDGSGSPQARGTVQVASLDTHDAKRDEHLRSPDFFDAHTHPEITFVSTDITRRDGDGISISGQLTLKGVTRPIELIGHVEGVVLDPWDKRERMALKLHGVIDRRDFGLTWNRALETGSALVADEVRIEVNISAVKRAADAAA